MLARTVIAAFALAASAAWAQDAPDPVERLAREHPQGSVKDTASAKMALQRAAEAHAFVERRFEADRQRCAGVLLVNSCMADARQLRYRGESEVHRVELEAHDFRRGEDAAVRARRKQEEEAQVPPRDRAREERERQAQAAGEQKRRQAEDAGNRAPSPRTVRPEEARRLEERTRESAQRAQHNAEQAARASADAAAYAKEKDAERLENEKMRASREKSRAQKEAGAARDAGTAAAGKKPTP